MNDSTKDFFLNNHYYPMLRQEYGIEANDNIRSIVKTLNKIFRNIDENKYDEILIINSLSEKLILESSSECMSVSTAELKNVSSSFLIIEEIHEDKYFILKSQKYSIDFLASNAIVYSANNIEEFFYKKDLSKISLPGPGIFFRTPSFKKLSEAIQEYKTEHVRKTSCAILNNGLWTNKNRIVLKNKPEELLQTSLYQFLRVKLRNTFDISREHNTNNNNPISPVDIKVLWNNSSHIALIEIKWLGLSLGGDNGTRFHEGRAKEGSKQLVRYLEEQNQSNPKLSPRGYLIIYDGRRKNAKIDQEEINRDNGYYYEFRDIQFDPDYAIERDDFEEPIRMFMEPICL